MTLSLRHEAQGIMRMGFEQKKGLQEEDTVQGEEKAMFVFYTPML